MRLMFTASAAAMAVAVPALAHAGDTPLYRPAPAWVAKTPLPDIATLQPDAPAIVVLDLQQRIEQGQLWAYVDAATRISTPEMLSQAATLALPWAPDKGDLIVHELTILRGAEKIDVLAKGQKFTVLRREQALEQRELTGILTATLAVEGLQVGDVLHLRASTTSHDAALDGRVQTLMPVPAAPLRVGFARARFSWPTGTNPHWKALAEGVTATPVRNGAYTELTFTLPAPKQTEMPSDAPARYRPPPWIELSTFADWADVSKVMAPLYDTTDTIAPGSAIAGEIAAIRRAEADPLVRAQRALELVQDKVRYLAVGMDGGNYVPQTPARTWEVRYGDCKAKTLLLLAMLHELGIAAEPVLAHVGLGDLVTARLPSAIAFNHILVRATIAGRAVWLDGTATGSRLADIGDTPPLGHVLPVRTSGAAPFRIETHANARPTIDLSIVADESGSVELPSAMELTAVVHGQLAAGLTLARNQLAPKEQREAVQQFFGGFVGEAQISDATISPDPASGDVTLRARGVTTTTWSTEDRRRKRTLVGALGAVSFAPDRSKASWAAVPVAVADPAGLRYRLRLRLPENGRGFTLDGEPDMRERIAGYDVTRTTRLADGIVTLEERVDSIGGEVPAARIPAERDAVATARARAPRVVAPLDTRHRWEVTPGSDTQVKAIDAVFARAIADDPEEVSGYTSRASLRSGIGDRRGALADLTKAIAITPSIPLLLQRAEVSYELGDVAAALSDAEAARALDPSSIEAIGRIVDLKAERGDVPGAIALLDQRIALGGETRAALRETKAGLIGEYGDAAEALKLYDALIAEKPGSPTLMNGRCWTKATRAVMLDTALKDCTGAIELSTFTAAPLDSRAMVYYRLQRHDEALADLDAVLAANPAGAESRFMRAVVLLRLHREAEAAKELAAARRLRPSIDKTYARYGITAS